jgi:phage/plasmid-like protein (TIGR03299 family)
VPAGIEYDQSTDRATFVAVRDHGWHQMGHLSDKDLSVEEGMALAHLSDLDYHTEPIIVGVGSPAVLQVAPEYQAVVRRNPFDRDKWEVLGAGMKTSYTLHTPEQAFAFGEQIIEEGKPLAALGSIANGKRAFASFRLDDLTIGGVDQVHNFLNVMTAFDGSMATVCRVSSIRVVCQNTFNMVMGERTAPTYKVRHTGADLEHRVDDARAALQVGWKSMERFQAEANAFLDREVTDKEFRAITEALFPIADDATDRAKEKALDARLAVATLWDGPTVENVRGTAWGALNAFTEWVDWKAGNFATDQDRMVAQITPGGTMDKRRASGAKTIADLLKIEVPATV